MLRFSPSLSSKPGKFSWEFNKNQSALTKDSTWKVITLILDFKGTEIVTESGHRSYVPPYVLGHTNDSVDTKIGGPFSLGHQNCYDMALDHPCW